MKYCTKCGTTRPTTEFSKAASKRDGLQAWCKACFTAANSEYGANWRAINAKKMAVYNAEYYAANADKINASAAKRRGDNPEAERIYSHNKRAHKRKAGGKLSKDIAERLYALQRGKCACCKQPLGNDYHLDHIMPLALGGSNTDDNIQLLRSKCNLQKNKKHPIAFMKQRGFLL